MLHDRELSGSTGSQAYLAQGPSTRSSASSYSKRGAGGFMARSVALPMAHQTHAPPPACHQLRQAPDSFTMPWHAMPCLRTEFCRGNEIAYGWPWVAICCLPKSVPCPFLTDAPLKQVHYFQKPIFTAAQGAFGPSLCLVYFLTMVEMHRRCCAAAPCCSRAAGLHATQSKRQHNTMLRSSPAHRAWGAHVCADEVNDISSSARQAAALPRTQPNRSWRRTVRTERQVSQGYTRVKAVFKETAGTCHQPLVM